MRTFNKRFADVFSELGDAEQVSIFNEWANRIGEETIESMDNFDDLLNGWKASNIASRIVHGDFHPNHTWFKFNGLGNLESANNVNGWMDDYVVSDLADWYEENKELLTSVCSEMEEICEDDEEEETEEETI